MSVIDFRIKALGISIETLRKTLPNNNSFNEIFYRNLSNKLNLLKSVRNFSSINNVNILTKTLQCEKLLKYKRKLSLISSLENQSINNNKTKNIYSGRKAYATSDHNQDSFPPPFVISYNNSTSSNSTELIMALDWWNLYMGYETIFFSMKESDDN